MKVLFLGYIDSPLVDFVRSGDDLVASGARLSDEAFVGYDFLISYGYRYIIREQVLKLFGERAINLHISYLPWNRGADPNLWSWIEDTPKGVTIHRLDKDVDTGDILIQEEVLFTGTETLRETYSILRSRIEELFRKHWREIRSGTLKGTPQVGAGTYHRRADSDGFCLTRGWDTPVSECRRLKRASTTAVRE